MVLLAYSHCKYVKGEVVLVRTNTDLESQQPIEHFRAPRAATASKKALKYQARPSIPTNALRVRRPTLNERRNRDALINKRNRDAASSRAHCRLSHVLVKFLAGGSNGECYLAIKNSVVALICEDYAVHKSLDVLCQNLRGALVVAKFFKSQGKDGVDLRGEITFLRSLPANRPEITGLVDFELEQAQWFTTRFVAGGTLNKFVKHCWRHLSTGLQYHIVRDIVRCLALVHFESDDRFVFPQSRVPLTRYADLHGENILVRPAPLPQMVLADFGRAETNTRMDEQDFRYLRTRDYQMLGFLIEGMLVASKVGKPDKLCYYPGPDMDCRNCVEVAHKRRLLWLDEEEEVLLEWAEKFKRLNLEDDGELTAFLQAFADAATMHCEQHQPELSPHVKEYLENEGLSRSELLDIVGIREPSVEEAKK